MKPLTWAFSGHVDAPAGLVFDWLKDYREDDHDTAAYRRGAGIPEDAPPSGKRTIIGRDDDLVELEDDWGRRRFRVRVRVVPTRRELRLTADHGYEAVWRTREADDGAGTVLEVEGRMAPTGLFGLLLPLVAKRLRKTLEADFRGHLEDARASLASAGPTY